jgi:hypothetical protein
VTRRRDGWVTPPGCAPMNTMAMVERIRRYRGRLTRRELLATLGMDPDHLRHRIILNKIIRTHALVVRDADG